MAIAIVEELWTRIRAAIDDKIVAATNARDQAVAAAATVGDAQTVLTARDQAVQAAEDASAATEDKADISWVNNVLAPDGNHGGLIVDSQLLGADAVVFNFPSKVSGQVTVRVTGRSPVTGNQALVGYMFRGPNGEKALEGMSGLSYSAAVGEPYRYLGVQAPNVGFTDSITVTPAPGWTLDGIVIRAWNEGEGNVLVTGVFVDTGLGPKVVTRDLNGGISVPLVPTSNASAAARGYVTARTPQIIVASSLPGTPISAAVYLVTGTNPGVYVGSTKIAGL